MNENMTDVHKHFKCEQCGGDMAFKPGSTLQTCEYCGHGNRIQGTRDGVRELDFFAHLSAARDDEDTYEPVTVHCDGCGATTTLEDNVVSEDCPYCGSNVVHKGGSEKLIKPKSLLPFFVSRAEAKTAFRTWINGLWFAPNALKKDLRSKSKVNGLYIPYWTYDSRSFTRYSGERGTYYYVTKTYTTRVNGKTVTRTKQVRKTRWTSVSGSVWNTFDDILVLASRSLPRTFTEKLEPWDLENLVAYKDEYLSGFRAESYQVDLEEGYNEAWERMDPVIRSTVERDIGGDRQRIHHMETEHERLTFKHILLPVWVSAYHYKGTLYRFLVNGRTAEVQGERPYSWVKITLAVFVALLIISGIILGLLS